MRISFCNTATYKNNNTMSADEDTELRDLVAQTLETNGVLDKIRAELRANVFLALEEQESLKNGNNINSKLSKFLNTKEGSIAASLVQDFLKCCNLDFTLAVFSPESGHADKFETRDELIRSLKLDVESKDNPLILEFMKKHQQEKHSHRGIQGITAKDRSEESLSFSPRSSSKIPQRIESKGKIDSSLVSDNSDRSIELSFGAERDTTSKHAKSQKSKIKASFEDEDSELLAELGLSKESNKKPTKTDAWDDPESKHSFRGNEKNGRNVLGSLKDAPPLPGLSPKKDATATDFNSSGDWRDLAAIEEKINKLGFEVPRENNYGYEDDFLPSSSRKSEEGLSITEEIEEDISIGSFAGSKDDDYFTTDQTVSQISAGGFEYREDIDV